jgi:hypothetical protein
MPIWKTATPAVSRSCCRDTHTAVALPPLPPIGTRQNTVHRRTEPLPFTSRALAPPVTCFFAAGDHIPADDSTSDVMVSIPVGPACQHLVDPSPVGLTAHPFESGPRRGPSASVCRARRISASEDAIRLSSTEPDTLSGGHRPSLMAQRSAARDTCLGR